MLHHFAILSLQFLERMSFIRSPKTSKPSTLNPKPRASKLSDLLSRLTPGLQAGPSWRGGQAEGSSGFFGGRFRVLGLGLKVLGLGF